MVRFPYFGFPFQYPYYRYYNKQNYIQKSKDIQRETLKQQTEEKTSSANFKTSSSQYKNHHSKVNYSLLYLDDIMILCLLFLLYKENVKDEMLFIALILLLLS